MQLSLYCTAPVNCCFILTDCNRLIVTPSTIEIEVHYPNFFIPGSHPFFTVGSVPLAPSPGSKRRSPFTEKVWRDGKPLGDTGKKWVRSVMNAFSSSCTVWYWDLLHQGPSTLKLEIRFSFLFPEKRACLLCYFLCLGKIFYLVTKYYHGI